MAEKVFASPTFFDVKWENKSTSAKVWQDGVKERIAKVTADLSVIQSTTGAHVTALTAKYLETMSIEDTLAYKDTLTKTAKVVDTDISVEESEDNIIGFKVLKVFGTQAQMSQIIDQIAMLGMEVDELEDEMPKELE